MHKLSIPRLTLFLSSSVCFDTWSKSPKCKKAHLHTAATVCVARKYVFACVCVRVFTSYFKPPASFHVCMLAWRTLFVPSRTNPPLRASFTKTFAPNCMRSSEFRATDTVTEAKFARGLVFWSAAPHSTHPTRAMQHPCYFRTANMLLLLLWRTDFT